MARYAITISNDGETKEYEVVLRGPGLDPEGRRYIFANTNRCAAFVEAMNFAYQQGLRDGRRESSDRLLIVSGTTPDNLEVRSESWWSRWTRSLLNR